MIVEVGITFPPNLNSPHPRRYSCVGDQVSSLSPIFEYESKGSLRGVLDPTFLGPDPNVNPPYKDMWALCDRSSKLGIFY